MNFLPDIPPIQEPQDRLAKGLVIAFSLLVMGLLFFAISFIFRELLLEIYVTQTPLDAIVHKNDYIEMWKTSLRFDAKFAYLVVAPGLLIAAVAVAGGALYRWACKLTVVYVCHMFGLFYLESVANLHHIGATGTGITPQAWAAFRAAPIETLMALWPAYPMAFDVILGVIIGTIFAFLWYRLASIVSTWNVWHAGQKTNILIALFCFVGFMWTCAQTSFTSNSPLKARDAFVSDWPIMNTITVNAPVMLYMREELEREGFFKPTQMPAAH